jgi:exopolyphosphatase/guanosine-5'-triphosphate,3'-diphosphate pyrophosphatase
VTDGERIAVVDIGTNSTRLLVRNVVGGRVEQLERRTEVTRLGDRVDSAGKLSAPAMKRVFAVVESYRPVIDKHSAEKVVGVATSAVREAKNGEGSSRSSQSGTASTRARSRETRRLGCRFLGATLDRPRAGTRCS